MAGPKGRLELTWMGKDQSLIQATQGQYEPSQVLCRSHMGCSSVLRAA
jgi:hypothetical protein